MHGSILGKTIALSVALFTLTSRADVYKAGDSFIGFSAPDQHGAAVTYQAGGAKFVLFDTPGESGESVAPKDPGWFAKNRALLLVNISELSSFKARIARSRMAAKPFPLLVVAEKGVAEKFPRAKGKFSVLVLDDKGIIASIKFAAPGQELQDLVTEGKP